MQFLKDFIPKSADMKNRIKSILFSLLLPLSLYSQGILINHTCTKIAQVPESAIVKAKQDLHIAYGHTSHGSQLTEGMDGLVSFMNGKGYPENLYAWNNGGTGEALDLHDYAMDGDVGYYPDWVNNTRNYLGTPNQETGRGSGSHADVNVIIWSWCGQVSSKFASGTLQSEYINPMVQLETDYPGVKFVYMTGHLDHWDDANNKAANQAIRDFCSANNKILYDFADIESYDPDGNFYQYAGDDCSYYSESGTQIGNWAINWQNSHTKNIDWYDCGAAHSEPLNANQKAYAAWWLWATLAGWDQNTAVVSENENSEVSVFPNPSDGIFTIQIQPEINTKTNIGVFSLSGSKVAAMITVQHSKISINLAGQPKGIYLLKMETGETSFTKKLVVR
jgi:hypothetical protein